MDEARERRRQWNVLSFLKSDWLHPLLGGAKNFNFYRTGWNGVDLGTDEFSKHLIIRGGRRIKGRRKEVDVERNREERREEINRRREGGRIEDGKEELVRYNGEEWREVKVGKAVERLRKRREREEEEDRRRKEEEERRKEEEGEGEVGRREEDRIGKEEDKIESVFNMEIRFNEAVPEEEGEKEKERKKEGERREDGRKEEEERIGERGKSSPTIEREMRKSENVILKNLETDIEVIRSVNNIYLRVFKSFDIEK